MTNLRVSIYNNGTLVDTQAMVADKDFLENIEDIAMDYAPALTESLAADLETSLVMHGMSVRGISLDDEGHHDHWTVTFTEAF